MKIENIKQLQQVITLCIKTGVSSIKIDGIELSISPNHAMKSKKKQLDYSSDFPESQLTIPKPNVTYVPGQVTEDNKIVTDELSEEQLLMWSSAAGGVEQQ